MDLVGVGDCRIVRGGFARHDAPFLGPVDIIPLAGNTLVLRRPIHRPVALTALPNAFCEFPLSPVFTARVTVQDATRPAFRGSLRAFIFCRQDQRNSSPRTRNSER